jgi:hypothetical protein
MASPPGSAALRGRDTNPELVAAAKALFNYPYNDFSREQADWLVQKKAELRKQHPGTAHFDMILDKLNLEQGVANRAMMADYLDPRRFVCVFFVTPSCFPLTMSGLTRRNPDEQVYIPLQEKMLHRWMKQEGLTQLPPDFDSYLKFISQTLEDNRKKAA